VEEGSIFLETDVVASGDDGDDVNDDDGDDRGKREYKKDVTSKGFKYQYQELSPTP
jgi:hypothetical protein